MEKAAAPPGRQSSALKPAPARPTAATDAGAGGSGPAPETAQPGKPEGLILRRRLAWTAISAFLGSGLLMFLRFFFPRTLFEPSSRFRIGSPAEFSLGVDERFKQSHRIWVVRQPDKMFIVFAKCTHLGCTPNWIEGENKFKCPCHGSGYDIEGRNFEGPAPRPMDRTFVELDAEGQVVVDTSRLFACPPGTECQFSAPNSYLVVS